MLDQVIQFAESNKDAFKTVQKHKEIIAKMLSPHMPPGISVETIINDVVLNENTLNTFKKAYTQFRDHKYIGIGAIQAIATNCSIF